MPTAPIESLIGALHSQLSAEFRTATRSSSAPQHGQTPASAALPSPAPVPPQSRSSEQILRAGRRLAALGGATLPMGGQPNSNGWPLSVPPLPGALERAASNVADSTALDPSGTDAWVVSSPQEVIDGFAARLRLTLQQAGAAESALPPRVTTAFWDRRFRDTKTLSPVSKASATGLGTHTHTSLLSNPPLG